MLITKRSMLTGNYHTYDLPITEDDLKTWQNGDGLIQNLFPDLTDDEREFLMTGVTREEWDIAFGDEDDEEWEGYEYDHEEEEL